MPTRGQAKTPSRSTRSAGTAAAAAAAEVKKTGTPKLTQQPLPYVKHKGRPPAPEPKGKVAAGTATRKPAATAAAKSAAKAKVKQTRKAAAKPGQQAKGRRGAESKPAAAKPAAGAKRPARQWLDKAVIDDTEFCVGDSAYVVMDPEAFADCDVDDDELETCYGCEEVAVEDDVLVECDKCLRGFHLGCARPALEDVPKGSWICQCCVAGEPLPAPKQTAKIAREQFGAGQLALVQILSFWKDGDDETVYFEGRWYTRPEETVTGRQKHHGPREVFLTQQVDENEAACLFRVCKVYLPAEFAAAPDGKYGGALSNDVYICEYEYDTVWQRFRRRKELTGEESDQDFAASDSEVYDSEDGDEKADGSFQPVYAPWMKAGLIPSKSMRKGQLPVQRRRGKAQGGDDWAGGKRQNIQGLGAAEIPEAARRGEGPPLAQARRLLTLTAPPRTMPCRESERAQVMKFVQDTLAGGNDALGRCLYVSGVPGTGKTATVLEVMRKLKRKVSAKELAPFQFVEINSLRLPSPQHAYTHLYEALTGQHLSPGSAVSALEEMFSTGARSGPGKQVTVVLVDEMDLLVTKKQTVLYNMFDWPMRKHSKLAVIGIANTMDLPERLLPRIASRLGGRRIAFQPYNKQQLEVIVKTRLEGVADVFCTRAIDYASRKVASVSGDVRRCLELCRRAAEVTEAELAAGAGQACTCERCRDTGAAGTAGTASTAAPVASTSGREGDAAGRQARLVQMKHIDAAIREMFNATHMQLMVNCCMLEKALLAALLQETRAKGRCDAILEPVNVRLQTMLQNGCEPAMCLGDVISAATRLGAKRLVLAESGSKRMRMKLSLNVPEDDLVHVLRNDETIPWLKNVNI
ncbi:hypothetical protein WJX72_009780 [[Myrmecia] bisecta]|uniref:Origin recognition complex subunit 1 n=1 Tax=[Myrmecia] bisecta TaxID=41462 RepID=A0AAW1R8I7_9CHLO